MVKPLERVILTGWLVQAMGRRQASSTRLMNMWIQRITRSIAPLFLLLLGAVRAGAGTMLGPESVKEVSPDRIKEIAGYLPDKPAGFGRPIDDRAYWSDPAVIARAGTAPRQAAALLTKEFPAWDDDAYLVYSRKGSRPEGEKMERARGVWLDPLVLAECVENRGAYLPLLNKIMAAYVDEPTWTLPAHDPALNNFHRKQYDVDLRSSQFGLALAESLYLLGDRLDPAVRQRVLQALDQRLLEPFRRHMLTGKGCWWAAGSNNWNAVCLSGVIGGALILVPDKMERAVYVAAGERYSKNYVSGFSPDGYCVEGVGYWAFGFWHYALLREELARATAGRLDLFSDSRSAAMALFGTRIRIGDQAIPPFGDCRFGVVPDRNLLAYCNDVMHLGLNLDKATSMPGVQEVVGALIQPKPCADVARGSSTFEDPLRSYFDKAGVLICRPAQNSSCHLGIGIKAGGNGSHSHNDIGSYAIAMGDSEPTGDPGGPYTYDNTTFTSRRYTHKLLNSFGHPLPVVAGQLQIEAAHARPEVLFTQFTGGRDEIKMDITSAYAVTALRRLTRDMVYNRSGAGQVEITDQVTLSSPSTFEDALITHGEWKQIDAKTILLSIGGSKLLVSIATPDGFTVTSEKVNELAAPVFTRLGIILTKPVTEARVTMIFRPVTN